jgi:hypothetical protein
MRGINRSKNGKKKFSMVKFILFSVIFVALANIFPSTGMDQLDMKSLSLKSMKWSDVHT